MGCNFVTLQCDSAYDWIVQAPRLIGCQVNI